MQEGPERLPEWLRRLLETLLPREQPLRAAAESPVWRVAAAPDNPIDTVRKIPIFTIPFMVVPKINRQEPVKD